MMPSENDQALIVLSVDNVVARLVAGRQAIRDLDKLLSYPAPGRRFMPSVRSGRWDGVLHLARHDGTFPAGLALRVARHLKALGYNVTWQDNRTAPNPFPELADGEYLGESRDYQEEAVAAGVKRIRGIFAQSTGSGKTDVLAQLLARTQQPTIILVHKQDLVHQTMDRLQTRLRFPHADQDHLYGQIGEGQFSVGLITIAMLQTLHSRLTGAKDIETGIRRLSHQAPALNGLNKQECLNEINHLQAHLPHAQQVAAETREILSRFACFVADEVHHLPARTYSATAKAIPAYFRYGLSATPFKSDIGTELNLVGMTGEIIHTFPIAAGIEKGVLVPALVHMVNLEIPDLKGEMDYQEEYHRGIVECDERNNAIVQIAQHYADQGIPTIILIERLAHGEVLTDRLRDNGNTQRETI